ncbi:NAD(P)-dependent dehydrogenase, short-chain alcohol dehydrogenase family [Candidatus Nitrotoga sp. BS]|uniref:SDR family oxidoreductase n=1 Tax=Candidatus Nitrotoga sp. BS TaxID=2890408 RepID=UPI001EF39857|nr:SDR family oxidoreductase [Candidatus Nitrotoga sp. BS]CAH1189956.1 NAD(P)-dependent dehydrogenase, short-chain alcohol dehydrogenase family [Candidatus Nitrotoga sp. BS]
MKTTLITGANRGIGLEFSRQYAAEGWRVLACSRNPGKSSELNKLAVQYPELIQILALDVSDHVQIESLGQELSDESIDLLINNAGIYPKSDANGFGHTDYAEWMQIFRINTMTPLKMAETFATQLARSKQKAFVAITSKMGSIGDNYGGGNYLYRSSKTAVNMVVKSLAIDLQSAGITSVVIHPGWVKTEMGGPNALISTEQSVSGMLKVIGNLTMADSGKFFSYDGQEIPW